MTVRDAVARAGLAISGLPALRTGPGATPADRAAWSALPAWRDPADGPSVAPRPLLPYLQWLAETRPVLFHGSPHVGLVELSDERRTRDLRAYGNRQAVFASQDPVWALWFALLRREGLHSTRNGSFGATPSVRGRRYLFSVNRTGELFGPGALYVLPDHGFEHEPRGLHLFDTAHRTHLGAVRPLAWFEVVPDDFPLTDRVITHSDEETVRRTVWNARGRRTPARP